MNVKFQETTFWYQESNNGIKEDWRKYGGTRNYGEDGKLYQITFIFHGNMIIVKIKLNIILCNFNINSNTSEKILLLRLTGGRATIQRDFHITILSPRGTLNPSFTLVSE